MNGRVVNHRLMSAINKRIEKAVMDDDGIRISSPVSITSDFYYAGQRINIVGRYLS